MALKHVTPERTASQRSRRAILGDILVGGLGGSLLHACERSPAEPKVSGELRGPNHQRAHRLLAEPPRQWPEPEQHTDVAIVGGGIAGLAAAWQLQKAEPAPHVTLVELESEVGGTARGTQQGTDSCPWGAHYLPVPLADNTDLVDLLNEVGALDGTDEHGQPRGAEQRLVRAPAERLFDRGRWHEGLFLKSGATKNDLAEAERFERAMQELSHAVGADGKRVFAVPVHRASTDPAWLALDKQHANHWLDQHKFTSKRLRWLIDYACRDEFGLRTEHTSAWAMLWYFVARLHPVTGEARPFLAWPEGNHALSQHLFERTRKNITHHRDTLVRAVRNTADGVELLLLSDQGAHTLRAKQVVLAVPSFVVSRLLQVGSTDPSPSLASPRYGAWVVANLHLTNRPSSHGFPQAWDNVLYESPSLGYVDAGFQRGADYGPTVWTYYFALCENDPNQDRAALLEARYEDWQRIVIADLERAHPDLRQHLRRLDIWRWGHAMPQPTPGQISQALAHTNPQVRPRIFHAHCDRSSIATFEEAFDHGLRAARRALEALRS